MFLVILIGTLFGLGGFLLYCAIPPKKKLHNGISIVIFICLALILIFVTEDIVLPDNKTLQNYIISSVIGLYSGWGVALIRSAIKTRKEKKLIENEEEKKK